LSQLFKELGSNRKKFNKDITHGIARKILPKAPSYINSLFVSGMKGVTSGIDFKYLGYRRLTPLEDYNNQFAISMNRDNIDISKSTLYKVEYIFALNGEEIRRVLSLPYVEEGGILALSDALYTVSPVLTEYVISSDGNDVFTRLLKDKLLYKKIEKNILVNGVKKHLPTIITRLYKFTKNNVNDKIPIALMLFIKHGFKEVFKKYFNLEVEIIRDENINLDLYKDKTVYSSMSLKPRILQDNNYRPHHLHIIVNTVKPSKFCDTVVNSLMSTFDLINVYSLNVISIVKSENRDREQMFWKILLGKMIFKNVYTADKIISSIDEYLAVVEGYIDPVIDTKLRENNVHVDDFYELLAYVIEHFDDIVINSERRSTSISHRYIDINYYMLYQIIEGINKALYGINKESLKKEMTIKDVNKIFNKHLSSKKIYSLIGYKGTSIALTSLDYSGDNYVSKVTAILQEQNAANGIYASKTNAFPKAIRSIHSDDLYIGTLLYLKKKAPSCRLSINHFADVDVDSGKFLVTKDMSRRLNKLEDLFSKRFIDTNIERFKSLYVYFIFRFKDFSRIYY